MLLLPKKTRDEIVRVLKSQFAPAETGFNLIQIAKVLEGLSEQKKEEVLPDSDKKPDEN